MMKLVQVPATLINHSGFNFALEFLNVTMKKVVNYSKYSIVELHGVNSEINEAIKSFNLKEM